MALDAKNKPIFYPLGQHDSGGCTSSTGVGEWNANTNGIKIIQAGSDGLAVHSVTATSTDTSDKDIYLYILEEGEVINLGRFTIPDLSGTDGTEAVYDVLSNLVGHKSADQNGNDVITLAPGAILKYSLVAGLTSGKAIEIGASGFKPDSATT